MCIAIQELEIIENGHLKIDGQYVELRNGSEEVIGTSECTSSTACTITVSNGATKTFTITNGKDGENLTITSVELKTSEGLIDTYVINYSDGSKFEFVVSNGANGLTPYIGDNGNWWIGEQDTGVLADWEKANNVPLTVYSNGLSYRTMTINNKTGYVVTSWRGSLLEQSILAACQDNMTYEEMINYSDELISNMGNGHLVIPNYIGNIPVIGIYIMDESDHLNFGKITLSRNTVFLGEEVFSNCKNLKEIDFNNCALKAIPKKGFYGTSLKSLNLPSSVTHIYDYAFDGVTLRDIDFTNIKYIGTHAFDDAFLRYVYLPNTVEYVGNHAFDDTFVYVNADSKPSNWGTISDTPYYIAYGVKNNGEYLYSIEDNKATVYQYLGNEEQLIIPETVEETPITNIGAGFNYYLWDEDMDNGTDKETYNAFKNNQGYISELIIGNNVNSIDKFALLNGNMFIYIEDSVEEIALYDDDIFIGCFINGGLDDEIPFSLIILENASTTKFRYNDSLYTYEELTNEDDEFEAVFKANIAYDNIYFDEETETYYAKDALSYQLIAFKNNYVDELIIKDSINGLPVKTIERFSLVYSNVGKIKIGSNINKIKPYAFFEAIAKVFVPNNVEIINAKGMLLRGDSIIYAQTASKPDDWDSNWNYNGITVVYSTSESDFDSIIIFDKFIGNVKGNGTIELTKYTGVYNNDITLKLPRTINGKTVTSISANFYKASSRYNNVNIYIPSTITNIEANAFVVYQYSYYINFYLEVSEIPTSYEENWCYNTYYGNSTSYIHYYSNSSLDY